MTLARGGAQTRAMSPLIDVAGLTEALTGLRPVRLLDVRWRLDAPEGRLAYITGHLPGAVYVDLERELSRPGHPEAGRHPVPALADLEHSVRRWGIDEGDLVIAYDDNDGVAAARAWWLLRRRGVDIRVLDGGLRAWIASGGLLDTHDVAVEPGGISLRDEDPGVASIDEAALAPLTGVLLDVRAPQHYRGSVPSADPVSGHIPGALNLPTSVHISPEGGAASVEASAARFADVGVRAGVPVVVYCSSGIASAHTALVLARLGIGARVYPGSWSEWARAQGRPGATGPTPAHAVHAV